MYHWITIEAAGHRFLGALCGGLETTSLRVWTEAPISPAAFSRAGCDGLVTATCEVDGRTIALVWSDFRVNAASFSRANSRRFAAFLRELNQAPGQLPLFYFVNSAGLSLMEGRRLFSDAFALWPSLLDYASRHPVFTAAMGKCLGLAPLLFGLGHYRVAVAGQTQINLTGPEVIALFFGERVDFAASAAAERFIQANELVHELVPSVGAACQRFRNLLRPGRGHEAGRGPDGTHALLSRFLDGTPQELIPGWSDRLRLFVGTRCGKPVGLFVNPPDRSNNMITVRTLEKYAAGLDLFRALGLPIVSLLDSPGVDPRFEQSDDNNLRMMLAVGERIIRYPHGAMGIITRRCFGGSATLSFPKVFGGSRLVAIRGSSFGTMHESIITKVLRGSPRLLAQWEDVASRQGPDLDDLLEEGSLDAVIEPAELAREVDRFLELLVADPHPVTPGLSLQRRAG